uniref:Exo-alpha-sialidase n=2 Tax=Cohnella candidum TaxID=2674991 RepID=A0A3G3K6B7_9BACL|nr:exo-alpha-sialidase [Cohnella candidum]
MARNRSIFAFLLLVTILALPACTKSDQEVLPYDVIVHEEKMFEDAGMDARGIFPGQFGAEYGRMLQIGKKRLLAVYTIYDNNGYTNDDHGGTKLQLSESRDDGKTWNAISTVADPGRDLDNGQLIELPNGDLLMACRSVRWQESYRLYVYKSTDKGVTWSRLSTIDENNGEPGSLGYPDKGVYEPHMGFLKDGRLAVFYANEKHVTEEPSYSQIISEKISEDNGATWGKEIFAAWDPDNPGARPGMPVWTQMNNGRYILTFEVCGTDNCNIHYKVSEDAVDWNSGVGTLIPDQLGGPFITSMTDGTLVVVSNSSHLSVSKDYGQTWQTASKDPWPTSLWTSVYTFGKNKIGVMNSVERSGGGHDIRIYFMELPTSFTDDSSIN